MDQFINIVAVLYIIYVLGGWVLRWYSHKAAIADLKSQLDEKIRVIRIETHDELLFAYDAENSNFLGQGQDEDEIKQRLKTRFPDKIFLLNEKPFSALELTLPQN